MAEALIADAQTTVTSLVGAVAGSISERIGNYAVAKLPLSKNQELGALGLEFIVRAFVSTGCFALAARVTPETSQNIFFSILYFSCDSGLVRAGVRIGQRIANLGSNVAVGMIGGGAKKPCGACASGAAKDCCK